MIAEWIQYGAAFTVAVIAGLAAAFGWTKNKDSKDTGTNVVLSPVVDHSMMQKLIETLDHLAAKVVEVHEDDTRRERRHAESITDLATDIRKLTRVALVICEKL